MVWNSYISGSLLDSLSNDVFCYDVLPPRRFQLHHDDFKAFAPIKIGLAASLHGPTKVTPSPTGLKFIYRMRSLLVTYTHKDCLSRVFIVFFLADASVRFVALPGTPLLHKAQLNFATLHYIAYLFSLSTSKGGANSVRR